MLCVHCSLVSLLTVLVNVSKVRSQIAFFSRGSDLYPSFPMKSFSPALWAHFVGPLQDNLAGVKETYMVFKIK